MTDQTRREGAKIQAHVLDDVVRERERQDAMFGVQNHHPAYWLALLGKQMGQAGEAVVNREWAADKQRSDEHLRDEIIQLAAVAVAFIEAIVRGDLPGTLVTSQPSNPRQRARALGIGDEQIVYDPQERI